MRFEFAIASAALIAVLAACGPAPAQTRESCAAAVERLRQSPQLRVQGGSQKDQVPLRTSALIYLDQAAQAAAHGDDKTCRIKLGVAETYLY